MIALAAAACGDDGNKATDAPVAIDAAVDGTPAVALTCASYCAEEMANCTGVNAQYPSNEQCLATCGKLPLDGLVADTSGNTLGCRIYHAGMPAKTTPATHCVHSGPAGNQIATPEAATCGAPCESFCKLNLATCTGANAQYTNTADCMTACSGFDHTGLYKVDGTKTPPTVPAGDSLACRIYHTTNAAVSDAQAAIHCVHTAKVRAMGPCSGAVVNP